MMCNRGFNLKFTFVGVWILFFFWDLSLGAPYKGIQTEGNVGSPLEDELYSLPKASEVKQDATNQDMATAPPVDLARQPVAEEESQPVEPPQKGKQSNLHISGYEEIFEAPAIDLTPRAVAEYLILTGDFGGFDLALYDLIRARVLNPYEVQRYKDAVGLEYERMLQQMLEAETSYLQAFNSLYEEKTVADNKDSAQIPTNEKPAANPSVKIDPEDELVKVKTVTKVGVVDVPEQAETGIAAQERNEEGDMELQKLLNWLDNEMRQEINREDAQVPEAELPKQEMVQQQVPAQPELKPQNGQTEEIREAKEEAEKLENRDNNGKMMTKTEPETKSDV